jgi:hypothetical protein
MKNKLILMAALVVGLFVAGCELEDNDYGDLRFENASLRSVQVISRTSEWGGFGLAPGESRKLKKIDNPDYDWEPKSKVDISVSSTKRDVIFVERAKELQKDPDVIVVFTNAPR